MFGELARAAHIALPQLDAQIRERAREARTLEQRTWRREQDANLAAADSLERLDALAGDLDVRLDLAESLTRRIERYRGLVDERVHVGEQSLGEWHAVGDDDEKARREAPGERGDERCVGGSGETRRAQLGARRGKRVEHTRERR
jgi:hypothetical protein